MKPVTILASGFVHDDYGEQVPSAKVSLFYGGNILSSEAVWRTAQLALDLDFSGAPILFSWPSKGHCLRYVADEGTITASRHNLLDFISKILTNVKIKTLHLVGHSMGCRALLSVLEELVHTKPNIFKNVVFGAPDVDRDDFAKTIPKVLLCSQKTSVYVSSKDIAIILSKLFHEYPRAGESGDEPLIVNGVDTIDASSVKTDVLGHSYFANSRAVVGDLYELLIKGLAAPRFSLDSQATKNGFIWRFRA